MAEDLSQGSSGFDAGLVYQSKHGPQQYVRRSFENESQSRVLAEAFLL
jgi:hypothetical protein